jgi:hypothetical protein
MSGWGSAASSSTSKDCSAIRRGSRNRAGQGAAAAKVNQLRQRDVVDEAHVGTTIPRASQTIPPSVRRAVSLRDHHRCQVPGCRHATFVDVHHLRAREDGGGHGVENLLTLCSAHHRACHRGDLLIERNESGTLSFRHADGTVYGEQPSVGEADARACAFRALRKLGFGEREVRRALDETRAHVRSHRAVENLIRSALERLTQHSLAKAS